MNSYTCTYTRCNFSYSARMIPTVSSVFYAFISIATNFLDNIAHSGIAPVTNGTATVAVNGLECGITYIIIAGGTLNGDLVGPRSSHGTVTTYPCPLCPVA